MNSMIEYIRQINQTAVTLKPEWLDRLRHVDAGADAASITPEIILAEPGERKIPKFREGNWQPPITEVNRQATQNSFEKSSAVAPGTESDQGNSESIMNSGANTSSPIEIESQAEVDEDQSHLYDYYTNSITTSDSVPSSDSPAVEVPADPSVDPMAETKITEGFSMTGPKAATTKYTTTPVSNTDKTAKAIEALRSSIATDPATVVEQPGPHELADMIKRVQASSLETPAVLDGIVRPTIMPLRPNVTTDVFSKGEAVPTTNHDSTTGELDPQTHEQPNEVVNQSQLDSATANSESKSPESQAVHPASQIVEIISGLEGTSFEALQQQDTVSQEEWAQYTKAQSISNERHQQTIEVTIPRDVLKTLAEKDAPIVPPNPNSTGDAPLKNGPAVVFPSDKRSQRFHYLATKKQKLVDSITDQVVDRFPSDTNSTIMLVSANRDVDVDGAASKIATCLASRELGDILLIDGNLESRQLTTVLGIVSQAGIADCCITNCDAISFVSPTDNPQLSVLGAGTTDAVSAAGQCPVPATTNMSLREHFEYSIISGGIPGDPLTDAWAQVVDGVYLLVDMDESDRHDTAAAVDYFRKIGARLVGCIASRS